MKWFSIVLTVVLVLAIPPTVVSQEKAHKQTAPDTTKPEAQKPEATTKPAVDATTPPKMTGEEQLTVQLLRMTDQYQTCMSEKIQIMQGANYQQFINVQAAFEKSHPGYTIDPSTGNVIPKPTLAPQTVTPAK
jgi:hypothetical protein